MSRKAALLSLLLILAAGAAPAPARAGWAGDLFKSGKQDIEQGKKEGNPLKVVGGYIEKGIGALFGGKKEDKPAPAPAPKPEEKPKETIAGKAPTGGGAPAPEAGGSTAKSPEPEAGGKTSAPAKTPTAGAPPPPAPGGDSTGLIRKDEPAPVNGGGRPDDPVMQSQQGSTRSSDGGGLVGVRNAFGRALTSGGPAAHDTASVDAPLEEAARQAAERRALEARDKALLDRTVAQIAGVGGADAEMKRHGAELLSNARNKLALGDFQGAVDDLTRAIALDPANAQAWSRRAEAYNRLRRWADAKADALKAVELDPGSALAWEQLAYAQYKLGDYKEALAAVERALALNPDNATAYWIRSLIRAKMGDMAGALQDLETAARLSPKFRDAWEQARERGRVSDPDEESSLSEEASRLALGVPLWVWALGAGLLLTAATAGAVVALRAPKAARPFSLARPMPPVERGADGRLGGKYELKSLIGRGGMGNVFEAVDHSLGRSVAVKKMSENLADMAPQAREMLVKEAKTVAVLHHPAIVDIYEIIEDGPDLYLVFELVRGKTATHVLAESGRLPLSRCLDILRPVCQALEFAHARQLVHRDLKPSNIMITEDGSVKLMDFGIARSLTDKPAAAQPAGALFAPQNPAFARTQTVVGTPLYMAPEMEQGVVAKQGDVYALGVCLYEMATGRVPFTTLMDKASMNFARPSVVDPALAGLDELLWSALQPDPDRRLASPREFLAALESAVKSTPAG